MKLIEDMEYHKDSEELVRILCEKTQNDNPLFFRVLVGYYFSIIASAMRTTIMTPDRGAIPVNLYAINLGTSGSGKGFSTNIMEEQVIGRFRDRFVEETFPLLAEVNLPKLARKRALRDVNLTEEDVLAKVQKEFDMLGTLVFSFDSGTPAAVKQMRHKLLMANAGAVNLQIDEIGSNLTGSTDVLNQFLELYDKGKIKTKLVKNTTENVRNEEIVGETPTNMLLFGTPSKLLNGSKTEEEFYSMLDTGYARRCFFGLSYSANKDHTVTPEQIFDIMTDTSSNQFIEDFATKLEQLADIVNNDKKLVMTKETTLILIEYRQRCEKIAEDYAEHEEIKKAELCHRYFKALKLAGAYAFVDDSPELTAEHLYNAIRVAEDSGNAFDNLLSRDRNYVKLAKYLGSIKRDCTQADLVEDLPFYRGAAGQKTEMLQLAIAWGYRNNVIIKKQFSDGIEFLRGETLRPTDLNSMILSCGTDITENFENVRQPWNKLHRLFASPVHHWMSHHVLNGYRTEDNAIPGFNMLVLDVDEGVAITTVQMVLEKYTYLIYTTKRHTEDANRFRIVMPINYELKFDAREYKDFMSNINEILPFMVDEQTFQRARKWSTFNGLCYQNEGEIFDALPYIPKTSKNEERKIQLADQASMDNLQRWVMNNIGDGNRNTMLHRYGRILVDAGYNYESIRVHMLALNEQIADKLDEAEIMGTIMVSVGKAIAARP